MSRDLDITVLLVCIGGVLLMIACWTFYIQGVRRAPKTEEWYDEGDVNGSESDGALFVYPYGSLVIGTASAFVLFGIMNLPEPVETVLLVLCMATGASESLVLRARSGFHFRGRLCRGGSSISAKPSALDDANADKPGKRKATKSKGRNSSGHLLSNRGRA